MENLQLSFQVVAPLLIYLCAGILMRACGAVTEEICRGVSRMTFYVLLPALCFSNILQADFSGLFRDPFLLYIAIGILALFFLSMALVPRFCGDNRRRGVLVQSILRSNDGVFGLAVASALMGPQNMGLMTVAVALSVPLFNTCAVVAMETFRSGKLQPARIVKRILTNPIVVACLMAVALNLLSIRLPAALDSAVGRLGDACAPVGFLALGGTLSFDSIRANARAIAVVSLLRLVVIPSVMIGIFCLLGYRGDPICVALILFGAPTAMSSYTLACAMDGDERLASATVAITSLISIVTVFLFIFSLKQMGVI